jgi:hypothetical protein
VTQWLLWKIRWHSLGKLHLLRSLRRHYLKGSWQRNACLVRGNAEKMHWRCPRSGPSMPYRKINAIDNFLKQDKNNFSL